MLQPTGGGSRRAKLACNSLRIAIRRALNPLLQNSLLRRLVGLTRNARSTVELATQLRVTGLIFTTQCRTTRLGKLSVATPSQTALRLLGREASAPRFRRSRASTPAQP